jgi:hypothetical protein
MGSRPHGRWLDSVRSARRIAAPLDIHRLTGRQALRLRPAPKAVRCGPHERWFLQWGAHIVEKYEPESAERQK